MTAPFETSVICPVLIGRTPQLDLFDRLIAQAWSGQGQTVLIAGEAGIGKSRLTAEASARFRVHQTRASQSAPRILQGRCFEPDRVLPYAPLLDLLRADLATRSAAEIATLFGPASSALARLLPEFAELLPSSPAQPAIEPAQDQRQLTLALVRCFARLGAHTGDAGRVPLLLLIEDLHWSDEASLEVLLALARRIPAQPILLLLTYRSDEVHPELAAFLAALDRERLGTEIRLASLSIDDVDAQIRAIFTLRRPLGMDFLAAIYAVTEGNPFFVEETLKSLLATGDIVATAGAWAAKPFSELRLPRSVQLAVQRRLDQVSQAAREVLTLAAIAGRRFDFDLLQRLTGHDEAELVQLIKQLIGAQLVVEESADVFAFRHALTRTAVEADLLARERRALHRRIAEALEQRYADMRDRHLADLAEHFFAAEDWARALEYAQRAGAQAQALYAPRAAVKQFDRAIEAARRLGHDPPFAVYRTRGQAHGVLGDFEAALQDFEQALVIARAAADRAAEWQSLLALGFLWTERDFTQTGAYFRRALQVAHEIGDQATIGHSLNRLGNWHMMVEQPVEARRQHEAALRIFDALNERHGLAETLDLLGTTSMSAGDPLQGAVYYERAIGLFRALKEQQGAASALTMLALCGDQYLSNTYMAAETNRIAISLGYVEEALATARAIDWRSAEALALAVKGQVLSTAGVYGKALEAMRASLRIAVEIDHQQWQIYAHLMLGALHLDLLVMPQALEHLEQARMRAQAVGSLYWLRSATSYLASACLLQGEHNRAETLLQEVLEPDTPAVTMAQRHAWCVRAELTLSRSDPIQAMTILDRLYAAAPHVTPGGEHTIPRLAILRSLALVGLGRLAEAEALLRAAQATAEQRGIRSMQWRIQVRLAALYQAQRRRDEAEAASAAARALVADLAANLADETLRDTFTRKVAEQLQRIPLPSPRRAAKQEYDGLTAREREVAALIAQGFSNRALADALVLSERTIAKHVENILSKLGFTSRAQIAVWAVERGLAKHDT
jgi:DNA-binding CsgD family transcriptional regulator